MNSDSIYARFAEEARQNPDAPAATDESRSLTYAQLEDLAASISESFPGPCKTVGIMMDHSVEMIAAILAVLRTGAAYVPVEPDFPKRRIKYMFDAAEVDFVITQSPYAEALDKRRTLLVEPGCAVDNAASAPSFGRGDNPAYILYTSGSTGSPKGIIVENRNVLHYVRAFHHEFHIGPGDVMLQFSVCTFDIFVEEVFCTLLTGAHLVIAPIALRDNIRQLAHFIESHAVTIVSGFPYLLLELDKLETLPRCIRLLISGGDVLRLSYVTHLLEQGVEIYDTYGPSETTCCATYFRCTPENALENGTFPIGHPVLNTSVRILDPGGAEVEPGTVGEIVIGGGGVSRGYLPGNDNAAFTQIQGENVFRSGDLGYLMPDGNVAFLRRKDSQVMIYGRRVETGEVENQLCTIPGVASAHVLAHKDEAGLDYLTAYIVFSDVRPRLSEIREHLSYYLPRFMIPEFFIALDSVPLTPNGKPDFGAFPVILKEGSIHEEPAHRKV